MANNADPAASAATVSMPSRPATPLASVTKRMLLALGLLAASAVIVYLGRGGYRDAAHPERPLSLLACVYYATVTLSTTGYGDINPGQQRRPADQHLRDHPAAGGLPDRSGRHHAGGAGRTHPPRQWRIGRWRSTVRDHAVIAFGYGTQGAQRRRDAARGRASPKESIVVVDPQRKGDRAGRPGRAGRGGRRRHPDR